eukprot:15478508-Alexandrium_andersonii.AAC.1
MCLRAAPGCFKFIQDASTLFRLLQAASSRIKLLAIASSCVQQLRTGLKLLSAAPVQVALTLRHAASRCVTLPFVAS